jgi:hypothetical protein
MKKMKLLVEGREKYSRYLRLILYKKIHYNNDHTHVGLHGDLNMWCNFSFEWWIKKNQM